MIERFQARPISGKPPLNKEKCVDPRSKYSQIETVQISLKQCARNPSSDKNKENVTSLLNKINPSPYTADIYSILKSNNYISHHQKKSQIHSNKQNKGEDLNTFIYKDKSFDGLFKETKSREGAYSQGNSVMECDSQSFQFESLDNSNYQFDFLSSQFDTNHNHALYKQKYISGNNQNQDSIQDESHSLTPSQQQANQCQKYIPSYYTFEQYIPSNKNNIKQSASSPYSTFSPKPQLQKQGSFKEQEMQIHSHYPTKSLSTRYSSRNNSLTKPSSTSNSKNSSIINDATPIKNLVSKSNKNKLPPSSATQRQDSISVEERNSLPLRTVKTQSSSRSIQVQSEININKENIPQKQSNERIRVNSAIRRQPNNYVQYQTQQQISKEDELESIASIDQTISIEDCVPLQKKKLDIKIPNITAKCWAIMDGSSGLFIDGKNIQCQREVASLTKIMTCYTVFSFFEKSFQKDIKRIYLRVSEKASSMPGTSACLKYNHSVNVWDLLHGLMLPSGNDAALCLAENIGSLMYLIQVKKDQEIARDDFVYNSDKFQDKLDREVIQQIGINRFLQQMNSHANELGMFGTYYSNPHGLKNPLNRSTAGDIAKLCFKMMENPLFREIVQTQEYSAQAFKPQAIVSNSIYANQNKQTYNYLWKNTNKLLSKNWAGIKTGITDAAGPCLASCVKLKEKDTNINRSIIIIVLCSLTTEIRWSECEKLAAYAIQICRNKSDNSQE